MRIRSIQRYGVYAALTIVLAGCCGQFAFADKSSSSHYQIVQSEFGSGSADQNCSAAYCARTSVDAGAGGSAVGDTKAAQFGNITTNSEPLLEVIVDSGASDLGTFTADHVSSKTMTISIRNYLSNGYVLQLMGDPPKYSGHILHAPSTPATSAPGTEQFGINAVKNTSPNIGADPVQVPSSQFSFGTIADDYKTPNKFMYTNGDVIAKSKSASGETDYTISMMINISNSTPAGKYSGDFSAVVIPIY